MKELRISIIATIIAALIICSCACAMPAKAAAVRPEFYPKLTIAVSCTAIDPDFRVIDCIDREGKKWSFFDDEGIWQEGDIVNLLMWALNENEEEDEIVEVYWEGHTDNITNWLQTEGWR